jgi:uncharacterized UPF0160 family protein
LPIEVGTHSGTFHADDVLAFALIRHFYDADATFVRTRSAERLDEADVVIDVGGIYDPANMRFDHHQSSYTGPLSSAGMVLNWLEDLGSVSQGLAGWLRDHMVDYVDAVDTGRTAPKLDTPCFCRMVEAMNHLASDSSQIDAYYSEASGIAARFLSSLEHGFRRTEDAKRAVLDAMELARRDDCSIIFLDKYYPWKSVYFQAGGETHPTAFVMFPSDDGTWKVVAIPPRQGEFGQKRSLPESWAGKMGEDLSAATGLPGSIFCHKNRFIAVFDSFETATEAMRRFDMYGVTGSKPEVGEAK